MLENLWAVGIGVEGKTISVLRLGLTLTRNDALNLAAWIVTLADPTSDCYDSEFSKLLKEARSE